MKTFLLVDALLLFVAIIGYTWSMNREKQNAAARFWPKVRIQQPGDCWLWQGSTNWGGYGLFKFRGKDQGAHRVAWILTVGEIPAEDGYHGTCVLHACDTPSCVNPRHLSLGTQKDNIAEREVRNRGNRPAKVNNQLRWTEDDIREIRRLHKDGIKQVDIAKRFQTSRGTISRIVNRKRWGWV